MSDKEKYERKRLRSGASYDKKETPSVEPENLKIASTEPVHDLDTSANSELDDKLTQFDITSLELNPTDVSVNMPDDIDKIAGSGENSKAAASNTSSQQTIQTASVDERIQNSVEALSRKLTSDFNQALDEKFNNLQELLLGRTDMIHAID